MTNVYAEHVVDYAQAGWPCILPVPVKDKFPPPAGFTGAEGRDTDPLQLVTWAGTHAGHSIALRMPMFDDWTVIGIDVDQYVKTKNGVSVQKRGAETLAACVERWGPLPATWTSTARDTGNKRGPSRIYLFRAPARRYATKLSGPTSGDVEIIQRHHRYAVVWPSPHPDIEGAPDAIYRWYAPNGEVADSPPKPDELAELPAAWVEGLAEGATEQGAAAADPASGSQLLEQLLEDYRAECADITSARLQAVDELSRADAGSRHDTMTARVHHLVQLAASGHTGIGHAILQLRDLWSTLTAGEDRTGEFGRMLHTSARKAVSVVGLHQVQRDPCLFSQGFAAASWPVPAASDPGDPGGDDPDLRIVEPPRWLSTREVIGTQAFDPNADLDQSLAERVLERTYPALRHAYDSGGWLLRLPERWELHGRLSPWAVAQVATLMPMGNPEAEKGSDEHARAKRRARLMTTAGARAVSGKMDDLVSGGMHPAAVALSALDAEPDVLWAAGLPWALGSCTDGVPLSSWLAEIDPSTPHLHSAAVAPERVPTPHWDALVAAVWPDEAVRRWALRVLSISLTGYPDRALPILLGETGRGKTQVIALLMSVLGSYAHAADARLMSEAGEKAHASIIYALKGRRLSFIDEGPREGRWAQERLKQLTGGGELTANQMNQNPITFRPTHTLVLATNDEPVLTDPAIRSRVRLIPCEGDPEEVRRTRAAIGHPSSDVWRAEAPGVLAALMTEAAGWLADPLSASLGAAPEHIRYLAENVGAEQDPVGVWVAEETAPSEVGTPSRELYQAFVASCRRSSTRSDQIPSETKWGRALTRLGYAARHTEQGKRRQLRVRSGGFLPGMTPPPAPEVPRESVHDSIGVADGLGRIADGLVTGSEPNPSGTNAQVNPGDSVTADGSDGLNNPPTHMRARARTREERGGNGCDPSATPSPEEAKTGPDLQEHPSDGFGESEPVRQKPSKRTAEATQRAAAKRAAARDQAIAAAAGELLSLPAVVLRDGRVLPLPTTDADALLATVTDVAGCELTVDVETTGFPVGHADYALRTVQLGNEHLALVLDPHDGDQADVVRRHLAAAAVLHAHSATADLVPLAAAGLLDQAAGGIEGAWSRMHDTVVLAKLADPASTGSDPGLKQLAAAMLGDRALSKQADEARAALFKAGKWLTDTEVTTELERSGWAQVDPRCETMVRYAASDVLDDAAIARLLPIPAPAIADRERTAQRMTARMAHTGLRFDPVQIERLTEEHLEAKDAHAERVRTFGVDNPGSDQQVGAALAALGAHLPRTNTGRPSVAAGVLEPLRGAEGHVGDLVSAVLDYRHHKTALSLFLEPWGALVRRGDGRARSTIYTLAADTGRMSSVRFNFQQISREGGLRSCVTADPGYLLASADFAGVELRTAAALSQDRDLMAILADPQRDLHWEISRIAFGPQATKANRYATKRGVFGRIYGGGVGAIARGVGVSDAVARQIIDAMDHLTPGLSEWSRLVRDSIESGRTQFPAYSGRVIHLPKKAPHAGPNYCIQGTARELLIDALMRWRETRWGEATILPVHDELLVMVPEDEAEAATTALVGAMTTELHGVPIIAEASTPSYAWSDAS